MAVRERDMRRTGRLRIMSNSALSRSRLWGALNVGIAILSEHIAVTLRDPAGATRDRS